MVPRTDIIILSIKESSEFVQVVESRGKGARKSEILSQVSFR